MNTISRDIINRVTKSCTGVTDSLAANEYRLNALGVLLLGDKAEAFDPQNEHDDDVARLIGALYEDLQEWKSVAIKAGLTTRKDINDASMELQGFGHLVKR